MRPGKYGARKGLGIGNPKPRDKARSRHCTWSVNPGAIQLDADIFSTVQLQVESAEFDLTSWTEHFRRDEVLAVFVE